MRLAAAATSAHPFRRVRGERGDSHRSAWTTCSRAARSAGKKPPSTPITTAKIRPATSNCGVTRKLNAISLNLDQFVVLVTMPLSGSAKRHPSMPPIAAMMADSARKLTSTLVGLKPRLRIIERRRILEAERDRLEHLAAEHGHQLHVLAQDLRLERRARGAEVARHGPIAAPEVQRLPDAGMREALHEAAADADLRPPRRRPPALRRCDIGAHGPHLIADAAHDHVGDLGRVE